MKQRMNGLSRSLGINVWKWWQLLPAALLMVAQQWWFVLCESGRYSIAHCLLMLKSSQHGTPVRIEASNVTLWTLVKSCPSYWMQCNCWLLGKQVVAISLAVVWGCWVNQLQRRCCTKNEMKRVCLFLSLAVSFFKAGCLRSWFVSHFSVSL